MPYVGRVPSGELRVNQLHGLIDRKHRHDVEVDAVAYRPDGTKTPVRLSNLSNGGCCIHSEGKFSVGERVQIAMPRMGYIRVQIRWTLGGTAGAKFLVESDY